MIEYSIQMVSKLTGIGVHTLRTWEKRYHCVAPVRKDNGHRVYCEDDLKKLQLLSDVTNLGEPIGSVAHLSIKELEEIMGKIGTKVSETPKFTDLSNADLMNRLQSLIIALESYRLDVISHEIHKLKVTLSAKDFAVKIISPLLKEIGHKVMSGNMTIAHEHALSSIIRFHVGQSIFQSYEKKYRSTKKIALATPDGEHHEFGILLSALLCSHYDIPFYYLGPNLPAESFAEACNSLEVDILILGTSPITNFEREGFLDKYLSELISHMGPDQQLWLGGSAEFNLPYFRKKECFHYISTMQNLDVYLKSLK